MKKYLQKKLNNEKGMTLIELLAVIVIIAIIAAIAIPAIGNIIDNSRVGAIKSDAQNIISAAELYYTDNPAEPEIASLTTLETTGYLDNPGSFNNTNASFTKVTKGSGGAPPAITGTGVVGDISVAFDGSTRENIDSVPNSTGAASPGTLLNTLTIIR